MDTFTTIETAYRGRKILHGELHDHSASGGTSDGKCPLDIWKNEMSILKMDFAAILDHRQVRHMYLPEWDNNLFISGSEPGTSISDSHAEKPWLHYNMLVPQAEDLIKVLNDFPEYEFTGGQEGHFVYPQFTTERFGMLMDAVRAYGGFFVIPHPKQIMASDNAEDYYFRDKTGIEVIYMDYDSNETAMNYKLWTDLLRLGKKVWACAGGDKHNHPGTGALTSIYARDNYCPNLLEFLREGDFTCGSVGIRMLLNDTRMGGECHFTKDKLYITAGDFHPSAIHDGHKYSLTVLNDNGVVFKSDVSPDKMNGFEIITDPSSKFYRVEVWDETHVNEFHPQGCRIAIGNPIWNSKEV